ncbi:MAG TPA: 3-oxoacyl-ACP synthase, partial [Acidimicrobiales bacterium]|nr:3-oxoacyl-ACP synthase [Acidimicrobiales bacterium]
MDQSSGPVHGLAQDRVLDTIGYIGNTSAASIPIAMGLAHADGRLTAQQTIVLAGFGAGMTWGSLV